MTIRFSTSVRKATEAALLALRHGPQRPERLLAVAFEADRIHLNLYGRPVCGGEHRVARFGPASTSWCEAIGFLPDRRLLLPPPGAPFARAGCLVAATREPDLDLLSPSDADAIGAALEETLAKGDRALLLHEAVARAVGGRVAWEHVLEPRRRTPEALEDLEWVGPHLAF